MRFQTVNGEDQIFDDCACCGIEFRRGPGIHHGQNVPGWNVLLCHTCKPPFSPYHEIEPTPRLLAALKGKGVSVTPNKNGMLIAPIV